jgi:C1A family cysteine protease
MAFPNDFHATTFPDKVDLRQYLWPVENVGATFASTAAAAAAALECNCGRMGEKATNLSTLFIHYNARRLSGDQDKDAGTSMAKVMEAIRTYGACTEATWPFDPAKVTTSPPPQAYEEAKKFAAVRSLHPADVMQAVSATFPVPLLTRIPRRCIDEAGRTGVMPALTDEERQKIKEHPGFALVVVGYDQTDKTFLVRNSWGEKWGEGGHCRIPFDLFLSLVPKGSGYAWAIDKAEAQKPGEAVAVRSVAVATVPDNVVASTAGGDADFPDKVDLRPYLWPVEDIGSTRAGAAVAVAAALECNCKRMGQPPTNLSSLFIHYNARLLGGRQDRDIGTGIFPVMEAIRTYGACTEATWPFDPAKVNTKPPAHAYEEAKKFAAVRFGHPYNVIQALSETYPVPFLVPIPQRCVETANRTGVMPALTDVERHNLADQPEWPMVVVGYDRTERMFLVRACYGEEFGDRGHCRIPFDVFYSLVPDGSSDAFVIDKAAAPMPGEAVIAVAPVDSAAMTGDIFTGVLGTAAAPAVVVAGEAAALPTAPAADVSAAAVPDKIDMRAYLWPVEALGTIPAAAAAAAVVALEYHSNRIGEPATNLSTLFVHYNARRLSGEQNTPGGTTMDAVMQAIATYGACREETWPLDAAKQTEKPPARAYEEAKKFAGIRYRHPQDSLEALSLYYPTPFVARIPKRCLSEAHRTGTLPALTAEERREPSAHPVHAMVLVGYDKTARTFLARNCWGDTWGQKGYCHIPFDVMNVLAPADSLSRWIIAAPDAPVGVDAVHAAAPAVGPAPVPPVVPAAARPPAAQVAVAAASAPAAAQSETLASMAARMRDEIRQSLTRDIADATRQVRDRMAPPQAPAPRQGVGVDACAACHGTGLCQECGGGGCASCDLNGRCQVCQ